jgi:glycosyltransferase involved in cell wall biosynthesis
MAELKVIQAIVGLGVGGGERVVLDLVAALGQAKVDTQIVVFSDDERLLSQYPASGALRITKFDMDGKLGRRLATFRGFVGHLKRERPHVIHAHMFHALVMTLLARPFCRPAPKVVFTSHSSRMTSRARSLVIRLTRGLRDADVLLEADQHPRLNAARTDLIPNGIRVQGLPRKRDETGSDGAIRLLFVGRLHPVKDPVGLVDAFAKARMPNAILELVGEGPEQAAVEAAIKRNGLHGRVRLLGLRTDTAELMRKADLLLIHSLREGLPMVALEAGAQGLPILSTPVGAIPSLLGQGRGFVSEQGSYAQALRQVAGDHEAREAAGRALFEYVAAHHSIESMARAHLGLYADLAHTREETSAP